MEEKNENDKPSVRCDNYFMSVAVLTSLRSKDPVLKVGACIVDKYNNVISTGYNDMPPGGDNLPWTKTSKEKLDHKDLFVCHAELKAIFNSRRGDLNGCSMFITHNPCKECAKAIAQCGFKDVVFLNYWHPYKPKYRAATKILQLAGIGIRKYEGPVLLQSAKL